MLLTEKKIKYTPVFLEASYIPKSIATQSISLEPFEYETSYENTPSVNYKHRPTSHGHVQTDLNFARKKLSKNNKTKFNNESKTITDYSESEAIPIPKVDFVDKPIIKTIGTGKHVFAKSDIDVGNMQSFLDEAAKYGIYFRITSGTRKGARTKSNKKSNHATGNAIDVTPVKGQTWEELLSQIKNSPELIEFMRKNKMRILDERSPEVLAKTGGTGAHFHISYGKTEGKNIDEFLATLS